MVKRIWAFDLGKGSIGETVREGNQFLHKASLLITAEFAETKTATTRRRQMRTRLAHKAREQWLDEIWKQIGLEPLQSRKVASVDRKWKLIAKGDLRLEREFAPKGDSTCYTSCLLRIKLLRGEKLEPWQIFKALRAAAQKRGYDENIPWKRKEERQGKSREPDEKNDPKYTEAAGAWGKFTEQLRNVGLPEDQYSFPCYYDAWKMRLWSMEDPTTCAERIDFNAESTRNIRFPREAITRELHSLAESAALQIPALSGKANYLIHGPAEQPYASYRADLRKQYGIKEGCATDWQGLLGQKIPRFDNRIINKCALIPRLNVCSRVVRVVEDKNKANIPVPDSLLPSEVTFLMKLKNLRVQRGTSQTGLTAEEIGQIFNVPKHRKALKLGKTELKSWAKKFGAGVLPSHEEIEAPQMSGRSRFSRPALRILKRLILSGESLRQFYTKELAALGGNTNPLKGLVPDDLKFLQRMGDTWEGIYIADKTGEDFPTQADERGAAICKLIGSVNDPIVRHRLGLFYDRIHSLEAKYGAPHEVVLEFVREDFMGEKALIEYRKFIKHREKERKEARQLADDAGATETSARLKYELLKIQGGECLYTGQPLAPTNLSNYEIDHIVPRKLGGPDAMVNYVLTTKEANADKLRRTPFEWLSGTPDEWEAYKNRVSKHATLLRRKKVLLLTSENATELVSKYTALAETAWISKLAQQVLSLHFGWPDGCENGERKITVISGGLTARVRRKYHLNSLLNPEAKDEEEAEKKNREDDRHHVLDAMVLSFIPGWTRNPDKEHFFRFPKTIHENAKEFFGKEIAAVVPEKICFEKPRLAETIYGARQDGTAKTIVQRAILIELARRPKQGKAKYEYDLKYAAKQVEAILDPSIQKRLSDFISEEPDETRWNQFCNEFRLKSKSGGLGSLVKKVTVTVGTPTEYKDLSKDCSGAYYKAKKNHKGQFVVRDSTGAVHVEPVYAFDSASKVKERILKEHPGGRIEGFFQSDCMVKTTREIPPDRYKLVVLNEEKKKRRITTSDPLPASKLTLRTIVTEGRIAEMTLANNVRVVALLEDWLKAGLMR